MPALASFAAQHHHSQCNVFDFLKAENREAVEMHIAGLNLNLMAPRTTKAANRAMKSIRGASGDSWRKAIDNKPWAELKPNCKRDWPDDTRPGPWAPQEDNEDEEQKQWAWDHRTKQTADSADWRSSGWSASSQASSSNPRSAPYVPRAKSWDKK